ncbi:mitochondrial Complex III (CIII) ubiquinol:cytochrome c oxidoreductase Qcr8 [Andalucia godoyi]|uniref:Cytochrome b-c1 complex subunit 8 n=1 Tax=Andalucia godoyi TaxID=505711 RepID=A0A8K0AJ01_ANDGO|nr:mitochondrial Complex III (CIII) ubiquinol:cytochrome c oxidoreductase Qcr8 [Andalucia godoyi]|eukprot:ANDGO_04410.mRNA.1 mitochondrial Complex III (CIII) ubiquinol:cytochrome c oxidoreductase Qcr8
MGGPPQFEKNVITYHISSAEQKLFKGFLSTAFSKITGKVRRNFFDVAPAVALGVATYYFTVKKYHDIHVSHRS